MKFKLGYIKQVIKEEIQSFANETEQLKDPYYEKSINVERPQELEHWFALLDMAKTHLPMACQANDGKSQAIISGLEDIHGWFTKTFQGAEKIEDNPAYSGMMNENQDKALNALNSLKLYVSTAEKLGTKEIMEYLNIIEKEIKDIPEEIKPEIPGSIRPGSGPVTFRPSRGVTIGEGEEK